MSHKGVNLGPVKRVRRRRPRDEFVSLSEAIVEVAPPTTASDNSMSRNQNPTLPDTYKNWATANGIYWPIGESHPTLPSSLYRCIRMEGIGWCFELIPNNTDEIVVFPESDSEDLINEIKKFKTLKPKYEKLNIMYKRGILVYGPPGSGKTSTIQQFIQLFTQGNEGIAVMANNPYATIECLQNFRKMEPDRMILVIFEDIDAIIEEHGETELLNLLDGESSIENVVFVATTNYLEKLDDRFKARPSRIDTLKYIGMPGLSARKAYLDKRIPWTTEEYRADFAKKTDKLSIAALRELVILTYAFELSVDDAIKRMKEMLEKAEDTSNSNPDSKGPGFF